MYYYLTLLNWVQLVIALLFALIARPYVGNWPCIAASLGAMATAGLVTNQYWKDKNPDREWRWTMRYFNKPYDIEITLHLAATLVNVVLGLFFWRVFWHSVAAFSMMFLSSTMLEYIWRNTIHKRIIKSWKKKNYSRNSARFTRM